MSDGYLSEMSKSVLLEFAHFMTGKHIGSGMSRYVVEHPEDPTKVIKIENSVSHFQNVKEWECWNDWRECKDVAKWLAPCHSISHSGTFLVMSKARDLLPEETPKTLPAFLTDHKIANFGMLDGRIVCRDYGSVINTLSTRHRKWRG